jgi:uncharacterized membrane protein
MRAIAIAYVTTLVVMGALDGAWLSFAYGRLYKPGIGHLMGDKPVAWAAVAFYLLYAAGVVYVVTLPALAAGSLGTAVARGAVLGLIAYGTYDLTSLAIMNGWPVAVTIADMIWGTVLTGVTCGVAFLVTQRFG